MKAYVVERRGMVEGNATVSEFDNLCIVSSVSKAEESIKVLCASEEIPDNAWVWYMVFEWDIDSFRHGCNQLSAIFDDCGNRIKEQPLNGYDHL